MTPTATYSPDDNKMRLYSVARLDGETYSRARKLGFKWAPKQQLFVAPAWSPCREDFLIELCGEIGDEDTTLADRAEERADRFETYSDKRQRDAKTTADHVQELADQVPFGQPILVGHHSERRARKHAEKIDRGMAKAVKLWDRSEYWQRRAEGVKRYAEYKDRPEVRARRIKTIEADKRRAARSRQQAVENLELWNKEDLTHEQALTITNYIDRTSYSFPLSEYPRGPEVSQYEGPMSLWSALTEGIITAEQARAIANRVNRRAVEQCDRWLAHYDNRLAYERALLEEQGGADLLKPKPKPKQPPLCNYRAPDGVTVENRYGPRGATMKLRQVEMTKAEYSAINRDYKGTYTVEGTHRIRAAMQRSELVAVFLTDSKEHKKPAPAEAKPEEPPRPKAAPAKRRESKKPSEFDAMREHLESGGTQVATAPQLYPTPPKVAARMVELAELKRGQTVLEPSAGTGALLQAIMSDDNAGAVVAVEISAALCNLLRRQYPLTDVHCFDFLTYDRTRWPVDRVIMNPPFAKGQDIAHIKHAVAMLKPGGRLVAICANGPRQADKLRPLVEASGGKWEPLPRGTFEAAGTSVDTVLITINKGL